VNVSVTVCLSINLNKCQFYQKQAVFSGLF